MRILTLVSFIDFINRMRNLHAFLLYIFMNISGWVVYSIDAKILVLFCVTCLFVMQYSRCLSPEIMVYSVLALLCVEMLYCKYYRIGSSSAKGSEIFVVQQSIFFSSFIRMSLGYLTRITLLGNV